MSLAKNKLKNFYFSFFILILFLYYQVVYLFDFDARLLYFAAMSVIMLPLLFVSSVFVSKKAWLSFFIYFIIMFSLGDDFLSLKTFWDLLFFFWVYSSVRYEGFFRALSFVMKINSVLIILQALGYYDWPYGSIYYSPHDINTRVDFFSQLGYFPLHQLRPSGIFPSTIYLSFFQIIFSMALIFYSKIKVGAIVYFLFGITLALTGSTTSVILAIIVAANILLHRRSFVFPVTYVLVMLVIYYFAPVFWQYNYDFGIALGSFNSRFSSDHGINNNLMRYGYPVIIAMLVLMATVFFHYYLRCRVKIGVAMDLIFMSGFLVSPLVLHTLLDDSRFILIFVPWYVYLFGYYKHKISMLI